MKPYKNTSTQSTVEAYQIYGDGIKIKFTDGKICLYLNEKTGRETVDKMKHLATIGEGLGTFIGTLGDACPERLDS